MNPATKFLLDQASMIMAKAELENRDLTPSDVARLEQIEARMDQEKAREARAQAANLDPRQASALATKGATSQYGDPYFARDLFNEALERRDLAGDAGSGANIVGVEYSRLLWDALRTESVALNIPGVREIVTEDRQVVIPRMTADAAAGWQNGQGGTYAASEPTFTAYTLTPKTVGVVGTFANQLFDDAIIGRQAILDAMIKAVAVKIDHGLLQGDGLNGAPTGLSATSGATSVSGGTAYPVDLSEMAAGIADLEAAYAKPTCFITTANVWANGYLPIKRGGTSDLTPLFSDFSGGASGKPVAKAFGLPILVGQVPAGYLLTVAGGEVVIARRQGISVLVDPYTNAHTGETRVVVTARVDIKAHADSVHITTAMQP